MDLALGFLEVTGEVHVEPLDAVLVVLDRLLPVVQGPRPFLDASLLGAGLLPLDADGAEVVVDRGTGRGDLLLVLLELFALALQALRLSFQVGRAGLQLGFPSVQLLLPRLERILRLLEPRRGSFHRIDEEWGGPVTRHVTSPPTEDAPSLRCSPAYISRRLRKSCLRIFRGGCATAGETGRHRRGRDRGRPRRCSASSRGGAMEIVKRCQTDERHL